MTPAAAPAHARKAAGEARGARGRRAALLALAALALAGLAAGEPGEAVRTANEGRLILDGIPPVPAAVVAEVAPWARLRSTLLAGWTRDGSALLVRSRSDTLRQLQRIDHPHGMRRPLTAFDEPVLSALRSPVDDRVLVAVDDGGDEHTQLVMLDPASGEARSITEPGSRNVAPAWDPAGQRVAYASTRRNGRDHDVWVAPVAAPARARQVVTGGDGALWTPVAFSPDGSRLLLHEYRDLHDGRVHLLDLASGRSELLAGGGPHPTANAPVGFDPAGGAVFLVTNQLGSSADLARLSLAPGSRLRVLTGALRWDVRRVALRPDGRGAAVVTNENGASRLYLYDAPGRHLRPVDELPGGVILGLEFSPDSRRLAMTLATPDSPGDVWVAELGRRPTAVRRVVRWTRSETPGLKAQAFVAPRLVHYPTFDQEGDAPRSVPAFYYRPPGEGPFPVVIDLHGGPEGQHRPGFHPDLQLWMHALGAAVLAPNVRGSTGYGEAYAALDDGPRRLDAVRDVGALLDWIETRPELDAGRVAVTGGSYGGYLALMAAAQEGARVRAVIARFPIGNLVSFLENTVAWRRDLRRSEYGDERDPEMRRRLEAMSPLARVDGFTAPVLVVQGRNDPRVPVSEAEAIVRALRGRGRTAWYLEALNEGHGFRRADNLAAYRQVSVMFLRGALAPAP